jgi:hypothetical protein
MTSTSPHLSCPYCTTVITTLTPPLPSRGFFSCSPSHNQNCPFSYFLSYSPNCPLCCPPSGYLPSCLPNCASHCPYGCLPSYSSNCYPKHSPTYLTSHPWNRSPNLLPNRLLPRHRAPSRRQNSLLSDFQCLQSYFLRYLHNCLPTRLTLPYNTALPRYNSCTTPLRQLHPKLSITTF